MDTLKAKICVRRDTTANWEENSNVVPLSGEVIVYTDYKQIEDGNGDTIYIPGIKIGDGETYVTDLPFIDNGFDPTNKADKADTVLDTTLSRGRASGSSVGTASFAFGTNVTASGDNTHAEGNGTTASGLNAHAEGYNSTASGDNAHAEGSSTASGDNAHAEGGSTASGNYAHAEGLGTSAEGNASHVSGKYNIADGNGTYAEIVGNGASNQNRSNARALDWSGNERLKGDLYVGCGNDSTGGNKVATETFVTDKIGVANGIAELDSNGKVPSSELPSYVDDVLEFDALNFDAWPEWVSGTSYAVGDMVKETVVDGNEITVNGYVCTVANTSASILPAEWRTATKFPATGEEGKIYIALDTNLTYRWGGSTYVSIASDLALGETSSTAYRGDRGKAAYDHATAKGNAYASGLYKITTNSEGHVTGATAVQKSDITALGIPGEQPDISGKLDAAEKGVANGVAELDSSGKVPTSQLPGQTAHIQEYESNDFTGWTEWVGGTSYSVGDKVKVTDGSIVDGYVCTVANSSQLILPSEWREGTKFPSHGETGTIYIDTTTNVTYRWDGSEYVAIGSDLELGETSDTAYRGDRGKAAYDHATAKGSAYESGLYKVTTNSEGHVTSATAVQLSDLTALGVAAASDLTVLYRQFWSSTNEVSIELDDDGKTYLIWSASSSAGIYGAMTDGTYGCMVLVSNGQYAVIQKGSSITVTDADGTLTVESDTNIAMGIVEL